MYDTQSASKTGPLSGYESPWMSVIATLITKPCHRIFLKIPVKIEKTVCVCV